MSNLRKKFVSLVSRIVWRLKSSETKWELIVYSSSQEGERRFQAETDRLGADRTPEMSLEASSQDSYRR